MADMEIFKERLNKLIKEKGWSGNKTAQQCGLAPAMLYRYTSGEYKNPTLDKLNAIAKTFNVPISYLLGEDVSFGEQGDFVSVMKWTLNEEGQRKESHEHLMFPQSLIDALNVDVNSLDVIEMPDNSMKPLLSKGDNLLCEALAEDNSCWNNIENDGVFIFLHEGSIFVSRLSKNFDGTLSSWQESHPERVSKITKEQVVLLYQVHFRCGFVI